MAPLASVAAGLGIMSIFVWLAGRPATGGAQPPTPQRSFQTEAAHFHHVHLNVSEADRSQEFYEHFFGALPIDYRDRSPGLFTERSFVLLNIVPEPPPTNLGTTIWHIGWAGVDGPSEYEWRVDEGVPVETPITALNDNYYMYFWGPDRELVEVYTGSRNHRFEHVHLVATETAATVAWFEQNLGLGPTRPLEPGQMTASIRVDNVNIIVFQLPEPDAERPWWWSDALGDEMGVTDGTAVDHIAFSYPDIGPVQDRMAAAGVEIVHPIATSAEYGHTSFFVRGPDGLLVEIVQDQPIPEGFWR
jgi:catechol 2,3-dioxygenase-like lactoylglutathione lyase family enzyme